MNIKYDPILGTLREADSDNSFSLELDFLDLTPYIFNCPFALKFTSQVCEDEYADLSEDLEYEFSQFEKLTVTPNTIGLIILNGVKL